MRKYFFLLLIISSSVFAAADPKKMEDDLTSIRNKTTTLVAQIRSIEKNLGAKNNLYLSQVQKARELQEKAQLISKDLKENLRLISEQEEIFTKVRRHIVLEAIDDDDENSFTNYVTLKKALDIKSKDLKNLKDQNEQITVLFSQIEKDLQVSTDKEESLQALIIQLEDKKSLLSQEYITTVEKQNTKQEEYDRIKIELKATKKVYKDKETITAKAIDLKIISPLASFKNYKEKDKVITFEYDHIEPVRAVASGKVEYAKELSSYGKVIIIDHGNQIRSIVLGDLSVKTQKGLIVKQGELIGYTKTETGMKKSLHFELRKNNKVQSALQALNFNKLTEVKKI